MQKRQLSGIFLEGEEDTHTKDSKRACIESSSLAYLSLYDLPDEIIFEILQKLKGPDLGHAALVCVRFRSIRDDIHICRLQECARTGAIRAQNVLELLRSSGTRTEFASFQRTLENGPETNQDVQLVLDRQVSLAQHYRIGCGTTVDLLKARRLMLDAAEKGSGMAMYMLGIDQWDTGSQTQALRWFEAADKKGVPVALYGLGLCYLQSEQYQDALRTFQRGAEQGCKLCSLEYGKCLVNGMGCIGTQVDEGIVWLERALEQGMIAAEHLLSEIRQSRHTK